jgi:hypothetical protein
VKSFVANGTARRSLQRLGGLLVLAFLCGCPGPRFGMIDFPWPPPEPTSVFAPGDPVGGSSPNNLADVAAHVRRALDGAGYAERRWYDIGSAGVHGFAVTTRAEQINDDGTPKPPPERWSLGLPSSQGLSWPDYLKRIVFPVRGLYRQFLICYTDLPLTQGDSAPGNIDDGERWIAGGLADYSSELESRRNTSAYHLAVYVYEFSSKTVDRPAPFVPNSDTTIPAQEHFRSSGLARQLP